MIKAGVIGATGYAGAELVRLLHGHPQAEVVWYGSRSYSGKPYAGIYRNMSARTDELCRDDDFETLSREADIIFTATPQGYCAEKLTEEILDRCRVIDLSADFRLRDPAVYAAWYHMQHANPGLIGRAVYGLCELYRDAVANVRLVANPGCYTTCSILTLYPLVKHHLIDAGTIVIDAKSGVSGAGRSAKTANLYCEVNENIKAYGVANHRHTPEIEQELSAAAGEEIVLTFTPHLIPVNRGILSTCCAKLCEGVSSADIREAYHSCYDHEYFIRLYDEGDLPETRWVEGSNYVDLGYRVDSRTNRVIAVGAIDNLIKGAAGQAVQNMNILFGLPEETGLDMIPIYP